MTASIIFEMLFIYTYQINIELISFKSNTLGLPTVFVIIINLYNIEL